MRMVEGGAQVRSSLIPSTSDDRSVGTPGQEVDPVVVEVSFCRVCEPLIEPAVCGGPVPISDRPEHEAEYARATCSSVPCVLASASAFSSAPVPFLHRLCGADQDRGADDDLRLSERVGELDSTFGPDDDALVVEASCRWPAMCTYASASSRPGGSSSRI